jgi:heptaprenyl diphosphate synthase
MARPSPDMVPDLLAAVLAAGGTERALQEARETAARAMRALSEFPASSTKRAFSEICDFVLNRLS